MTTIIGKRKGMHLAGGLFTAAGQFFYAKSAGVAEVSPTPAGGQFPHWDGTAPAWVNGPHGRGLLLPAGAIAEGCVGRFESANYATALTSGTLHLTAIGLYKGQTVSTVSFTSGTTAAGTPTNQWFGLFDSGRNKLAVTNDDTTTAWAASTTKTLTLSAPVQITATGLYYVGICVVATTVPTLTGVNQSGTVVSGAAPILNGTSSAALTTPASCPATPAAINATTRFPYVYVS